MGAARRGVSTVVERIDPGVLADLIIKSTALQEMTNGSLREKQSPYRISEVNITASIPPGITFAISRMDDKDEVVTGTTVSSEALAADLRRGRRGGHRARRHEPQPGAARRGPQRPRQRGARGPQPPLSSASTSSIERGRPLAGRTLGDLDAAGRQRARADGQDPGHPEQLGIGELHARATRRGRPTGSRDPASSASWWRRSAISSTRGSLVAADRDEVRGVRGDLGRPDDPLVVVVGLDDAGRAAPDADPVRAHDDRVGDWPSSPR